MKKKKLKNKTVYSLIGLLFLGLLMLTYIGADTYFQAQFDLGTLLHYEQNISRESSSTSTTSPSSEQLATHEAAHNAEQQMVPPTFEASTEMSLGAAGASSNSDSSEIPLTPVSPIETTSPVAPANVSAGTHTEGEVAPPSRAPNYLVIGSGDPGVWIAKAISVILIIAGVIAVIMIIIGGIRYIVAYGKDENLENAKKTIMWAILGLLAIILSYFIVQVIIYYLYTNPELAI